MNRTYYPTITRFAGAFSWLSNFAPVRVTLAGMTYASVEHAYQAAKTLDPAARERVRGCKTPALAKKAGRRLPLREDWLSVRDEVMLGLTRQKYAYTNYRNLLLRTEDAQIVEGNHWGDTYWGVCRGEGLNKLGEIIMQVRGELQ